MPNFSPAVMRKAWSSAFLLSVWRRLWSIYCAASSTLTRGTFIAMNSSIAIVPVASWRSVWSIFIAISLPGTSSPSTRWASRIFVARFLAIVPPSVAGKGKGKEKLFLYVYLYLYLLLCMNRSLFHIQRRLLHRLRQCRMGMEGKGDIFGAAAEGHYRHCLDDHVGGPWTYYMDAKYPSAVGLGEYLHEALCFVHAFRAAVGHEAELADAVG